MIDKQEMGTQARWLVRATWMEDEAEATHEWEVEADSVGEAVAKALARVRFQPHHVEARLRKQNLAD